MTEHPETHPHHVLYVEDNEHDVIAFRRTLSRSEQPFRIEVASNAEDALELGDVINDRFDIIVSDQNLPGMSGLELIQQLYQMGVTLPSIIVTGAGNESLAVVALKNGITDYIVKDHQNAYLDLLPIVINEAIENHHNKLARIKAEAEKERLIRELKEALAEVKKLSGMLPICASCKKIRDDTGYWNQIEVFIEKHSEALFSHGICPECAEELYGQTEWFKKKKQREEKKDQDGEA